MTSEFVPFGLERIMSTWENEVDYNLCESGVHPLTARQLVTEPGFLESLLDTEINYPQSNGNPELRENIARLYPGATADNVLVTVGAIQANATAFLTLLEPGDEVAVMVPNYMQLWGMTQNFGHPLSTFALKEELGWGVDTDELERAVSDKTRLIALVNPNNPTGHILTQDERDAIIRVADKHGAWLLCDEVYSGAERTTDVETPSFYGHYDKVIANNSMSKAYGLPGLRLGWSVGPKEVVAQMWARQDYLTICATMMANKLAAYALRADVRPRILARTRDYVRAGHDTLEAWVAKQGDVLRMTPSQAAAIAFIRYNKQINSTDLVMRLIKEKSAFVVPGDMFGLDHFLRVSFGLPAPYVNAGLDRLAEILDSVD